jgi:hypothetical protein
MKTIIRVLPEAIRRNHKNDENDFVLEITHPNGSVTYSQDYTSAYGLTITSNRFTSQVWLEDFDLDYTPEFSNHDVRVKRIHVNQHSLVSNLKVGKIASLKLKPLITMKVGHRAVYSDSVKVLGIARIVYDKKGLSCGAKVYVETVADTLVLNPSIFMR